MNDSATPLAPTQNGRQPVIEDKSDAGKVMRRRETALTRIGIVVTLVATPGAAINILFVFVDDWRGNQWAKLVGHSLVAAILVFLVYGGLVYLFARLAFIQRLRRHIRCAPEDFDESLCPLAILGRPLARWRDSRVGE